MDFQNFLTQFADFMRRIDEQIAELDRKRSELVKQRGDYRAQVISTISPPRTGPGPRPGRPAKLSQAQIANIHATSGTAREIAVRLGIPESSVNRVRNAKPPSTKSFNADNLQDWQRLA